MKQTLAILGSALLLVLAVRAYAETAEDIIALAQKGVGEEVMAAAVENSKTGFQLSAADIIKCKDSKVPDKVITAMIRHHPATPAAAAMAPAVPAPPAAPVIAAADGILNIENLDDKVWSYSYDPDGRTIWISSRASDGRGNLDAHGGLSIRMPAGSYKVRYNGRDSGPSVTVFSGEKSLIMISRVDTPELEALYATVFERGDKKASDRIATLRSAGSKGSYNSEPVRERIVEVPATNYVYRSYPAPVYVDVGYPSYYGYWGPYHYGSRYSYPSYYRSPSFGFGYSRYGHRSGLGVRVGF